MVIICIYLLLQLFGFKIVLYFHCDARCRSLFFYDDVFPNVMCYDDALPKIMYNDDALPQGRGLIHALGEIRICRISV